MKRRGSAQELGGSAGSTQDAKVSEDGGRRTGPKHQPQNWRLWKQHEGRAHTGTHVHTPLCREDVEMGASETNAEAMGGKKRKKSLEGEEERKVMPQRALGGPHTWKPGERHVLGANTQALSRERNLGSLAEGSPISPQPWWVQQCPRSLALRAPGQARTPQGRETHSPHPQSLATSLPWDTCHVWGQASLVTSSIHCQRAKKDNQKALGHRLRSKGVSPTSAL